MNVVVDGGFLIFGVGEVGLLRSGSASEPGQPADVLSTTNLGVPEMCGEVIALLAQLERYYLMHRELEQGMLLRTSDVPFMMHWKHEKARQAR